MTTCTSAERWLSPRPDRTAWPRCSSAPARCTQNEGRPPMTQLTNPVLDADWPDPDVIRVGTDYYLVASSFNRAPGLPVLHSTDLVSWEHVTNAVRELPPVEDYAVPRHGSGVWAPSLRFHDRTYFIVYPDPDYGIYVLTTQDPRGEWSLPHLLMAGTGLIDPCPLWDDDGRTYLVHAWAKSRSGVANRLTVVEAVSYTHLRAH